MGFLPAFIDSDRFGAPALQHYQQLMEQAANARSRGEHRMAQQLASAAHKWAMDELVRVRHLDQATENLARATKQLNTAWDRDRSCASIEELGERHPETRRTIAAWVSADNLVRELETPTIPDTAPDEQTMTRWSRASASSTGKN